MCNIRGFQFRCGHTVYRFISTCRATFAEPYSQLIARCRPPASFNVLLSESCLDCQYEEFSNHWKERIAQAEQKRDDLSTLLRKRGSQPEDHGWNSWSSWDGWSDWSDGWNDEVMYANANDLDGSVKHGGYIDPLEQSEFGEENNLSPEQETRFMRERDEAENLANQLQAEYNKETWEKWEPYLHCQSIDQKCRKVNDFNQRRKTSPKIDCGSPLKHVQNAADLPMEEKKMDPGFTVQTASRLYDDDESDSDERSNSTESVYSPIMETSDPLGRLEQFTSDWDFDGKGMEIKVTWKGFESNVDDSDVDDMLPIWLNCN